MCVLFTQVALSQASAGFSRNDQISRGYFELWRRWHEHWSRNREWTRQSILVKNHNYENNRQTIFMWTRVSCLLVFFFLCKWLTTVCAMCLFHDFSSMFTATYKTSLQKCGQRSPFSLPSLRVLMLLLWRNITLCMLQSYKSNTGRITRNLCAI